MTNYAGLEPLREDVAALASDMCDLRQKLNGLEGRWRYDADPIAERLARQSICRINALFLEAYREALTLDACFKD